MRARLQQTVIDNQSLFEVLVDAVRVCSLGQTTNALFEVGGSTAATCSFCSRLRTAHSHRGSRSVSTRFFCSARVLPICKMQL